MKTTSISTNQDERHFIGHPQKSTILGSIQSLFRRLPMASFKSGVWYGLHFRVVPIDKKVIFPWILKNKSKARTTFPYFTDNKVQFYIEIYRRDEGAKLLSEIPIFEKRPEDKEPRKIGTVDKIKDDKIFIVDELYITEPGIATYSIDTKGSPDYRPLVSAEFVREWDIVLPIFYIFLAALFGFIFSRF